MPTILTPYLNFRGDARAALDFYETVFGGALTRSTFADFQMEVKPDEKDLVMHSQLTTPGGLTIMASDTPSHMDYNPGDNFSVSLSGTDEEELTGFYDKLIEGGTVLQPLTKAPWGDSFGMWMDKFGIRWLVNISGTA